MKPALPKGTRDFLPNEVLRRQYIFNIIESVFRTYGYVPIQTPSLELLSTLMGKYGEEGDRLLFKILNNGDYLKDVDTTLLQTKDSDKTIPQISKRGLRYDLTVPFARFVVMHQNDINFPFKRYQIQQVWRADRPQKGRYQEFYQCDVDVVGSDSLIYEAELMHIYAEVFAQLGIHVKILINNRKILFGLAESFGLADKFVEMTTCLDKLDKIGEEKVIEEMVQKGIPSEIGQSITHLIARNDINILRDTFVQSETGLKGIEEVTYVMDLISDSIPELIFDVSLARGLGYYTGCIFEVKVDTQFHSNISMGSIGGGGRYDNLTSIFGLDNVSGVGISFGAERIYDVMESLDLFPSQISSGPQIVLISMDDKCLLTAFAYATQLRKEGIVCDIYPTAAKMKKQMNYANAIQAAYVGIIGEEEREENVVMLKNMREGTQSKVDLPSLIRLLSL